jgi:hypothetical protein
MGAVFRPKDLGRGGYKRVVENSVRDLHPNIKESVIELLESWGGTESEKRLEKILGYEKAQNLLKSLNSRREDEDPAER